MDDNRITDSTRRQALKALAATTGAISIASLPARWSKPALRFGAVPAHAQISFDCTAPGALYATASWADAVDIEFVLEEPGGFRLHPDSNAPANGDGAVSPLTGALHGGDATTAGTETIAIPPGGAFLDLGNFVLHLYNPGSAPVTVTLTLCTECENREFSIDVPASGDLSVFVIFADTVAISGCTS